MKKKNLKIKIFAFVFVTTSIVCSVFSYASSGNDKIAEPIFCEGGGSPTSVGNSCIGGSSCCQPHGCPPCDDL